MSSSTSECVYGLHAVQALLTRHAGRVRQVWLQTRREDARAQQIEALARAAGCPVGRLDAQRFQARLGDVVHQGVMAEVIPLAPWDEDRLLEAVSAADSPLLLALDGVQDPHNLGACVRTADACGALAVVIPKDRAAPLNATARKVAAGAAESTPVAMVTNLARTIQLLQQVPVWVVGADAAAEQPASAIDLSGPRLLVVGAEGSGLRALTRRHCDWLVHLPSLGSVESLNVSVAAGMLLYEAVRQRR